MTKKCFCIDREKELEDRVAELEKALLEAADYVSEINGEEPQRDWKRYYALVAEVKK